MSVIPNRRPVNAVGALTGHIATPKLRAKSSERVFLAAIALVQLLVLFTSLDNAYLSIGEGNTAQLGKNVLEYGYPKAWDGNYLVVPLYETTVNDDLAWVSHPWLQYYLAAAGILVFDTTSLGARFFFVLCGIGAVIALYFLALRISSCGRLALLATLIFGLHPLFWFYSRQSRYYAPTMLLMALAALTYLNWADRQSKRNLAFFIVSSALLFYSLYTVWGFTMLAIGVHYLLFRRTRQNFVQFALAAAAIGVLTLPFFLYAPPHFHFERPPTLEGYPLRLLVHLWKIHTLYYPLLTLPVLLGIVALVARASGAKKTETTLGWRNEYWLLLAVPAYVLFIVVYPFFTTHYMLPVLPAGAIVTAYFVLKIREYNRWIAAPVLALLFATNILHVLPYILVDKLNLGSGRVESVLSNPTWTHTPGTPLSHYLTEQLAVRFYAFDFFDFLTNDYRHELKGVITYLKENASPDQTVYVPWNDADAVAFYTGMKVRYHLDTTFFKNEHLKSLAPKGDDADWINPLTFDIPPHRYLSAKFFDDYERIKFPYPKEYFETYPNIDFFGFRTNNAAPSWFYLFKSKTKGVTDGQH
ncbi:MAG TPA: glycosyltransferase family 39 protein [Blastocatellia bacterium]|nr:glycosyltransferase family 39 protein [Blastocatellia bacterium]